MFLGVLMVGCLLYTSLPRQNRFPQSAADSSHYRDPSFLQRETPAWADYLRFQCGFCANIEAGYLQDVYKRQLLIFLYNKLVTSIASIPLFSPVDIGPMAWRITLLFMLAGSLFGALGGLISLGKYLKNEGGDLGGL